MSVDSETFNFSAYNLIYIDFDNTINIVNKDTWIKNNVLTLDKNSLKKLEVVFSFSKITQIHTGEYIFINENCNLCICDSNFSNARLLTDKNIYYKGVTQLSNYLIALITPDGSIHCINSLKKMTIIPYYNDGVVYSSIKQTFGGKVIMVEGTMCGETYTFDLTKEGLKNKTILPIDKTYTSRITIAMPNNAQILNLNCDKKNKYNVYKYNFVYDLNISLPKSPCDDSEDYEDGLCYSKCRDGFKGIGPVCWDRCDEGWIDDGAFCRKTNACEDDQDHDGALCYPKCRDGYKGIGPVCWKKCDDGWIDDGATCRKTNACEEDQDHDGALCYPKCRDGYNGIGPVCWKRCSEGWIDDGATCRKANACEEDQDHDGALCYPKCRDQYKGVGPVCWKECFDNWQDDGVFCRKTNACEEDQDHDGALCYPKCRDGYNGIGPVCWKRCDNGWIDDGATCRKTNACEEDQDHDGALCYPKCRDGFKGMGPVCWGKCDEGWIDDGATCRKTNACEEDQDHDGALCYPKCRDGYKGIGSVCWKKCDDGWIDDGAFCRKTGACEDDQDHDGALCYPKCRDGYKGIGPVCWKKCDDGWIDDGAFCRKTGACEDNQDHVGALCYPKCRDGYKGEGAVCWGKCDSGWIDDGATCRKTNACEEDQDHDGALCYPKCRDGYKGEGSVCWGKCKVGDVDVGALCREKCADGYKDVAGVCWKDKALTYDRGIGTMPSYSCPTGYKVNGLVCVKDAPPGYSIRPGDIINYWSNEPLSYSIDTGTIPSQDNSACNSLDQPKSYGIGTCTGWDKCSYKTERICTKLCKSCTYDNYTWGCNADRCGREADVCAGGTCLSKTYWDNCCSRGPRKCCGKWYNVCGKMCDGDCIGCAKTDWCASKTPVSCSPGPAKCCDDGIKTTFTGINCDKCGTYESCTGGDCIGEIKTRDAPRSCPSDKEFDDAKTLCYEKCRDGFEKRPGDVISCWNKKPTIKIDDTKNVIMTCPVGKVLENGLCYDLPRDDYKCDVTVCSLQNPSYTPKTYSKDSYGRGFGSPDVLIKAKTSYGRGVGSPDVLIKAKDSYGRGEGKPDVLIKAKDSYGRGVGSPDVLIKPKDSYGRGEGKPDVLIKPKDSYGRGEGKPDVIIKPKDSYGRGEGKPDVLIKAKDSYGRGEGKPDVLIKAKDSYGRGEGKPDVLIKNKYSYGRGEGKFPKNYDPITCGANCCSFDLTFFNNNYYKPNGLIMDDLPIKDKLVAYYNADSFLNGVWYDLTDNLNNAVYTNGNISKVNNYLVGNTLSSILFPFDILPDEYTIFHICKYNGKAQGKILSGYQSKWSSGFDSGKSGVAIHDNWITQSELSLFDDKWVFSTDTNNSYRANLNNYTIVQNDFTAQTQLSINLSDLQEERSDWAIACIIVFERKLSSTEIDVMEKWLTNKYADLWSQTYYKTFKQLGYDCFDNKIGMITNNYSNYEFASYNGEKIDCKWLNYPQKNQLTGISCESKSNKINTEEGFENIIITPFKSLYNYLFEGIDMEFMIKLIIIIIILLVLIYHRKKNYKRF